MTDSEDGSGGDGVDVTVNDATEDDATNTDAIDTDATGDESEQFAFDDVAVVMGTYNEEAAVGTVIDDIERVTDGRAEVRAWARQLAEDQCEEGIAA